MFASRYFIHDLVYSSMIEWTVPKPWRKFARQYATLIKDITDTLSSGEAVVYPPRKLVFEMMDHLAPKEIRAIMVGQNPYPDDNARGIPFASAKGRNTSSLEKMHKELQREYPYLNLPRNINRLVLSWVNQGVFMVNMSMTIGSGKDPFLTDHSVMWEEFVRELVDYIVHKRRVPVILMGQVAWELDVPGDLAIKVPHPVARDGGFVGCGVFSRCNEMLKDDPILWAVEVGDCTF